MKHKQLRESIVSTVLSFCDVNNIDYRTAWLLIYTEYENTVNIPVLTWYKWSHKSKLDFLAEYEKLYGTLTKLNNIVKELI